MQSQQSNPLVIKARKHIDAGNVKAAIPLLKKIVKKNKTDVDSLNVLATLYAQSHAWKDAAACFKQLARLNPGYPNVKTNAALACMHSGDHEHAISLYRDLCESTQDNRAFKLQLARLYVATADNSALLGISHELVESTTADHATLRDVADLLYIAGELSEAVLLYQSLLEQKESAELHDKLAICFCGMGEIKLALQHHEAAIELEPDNASFNANYLLSLHYDPELSASQLKQRHLDYTSRCLDDGDLTDSAQHAVQATELKNSGKLRVAFVSADFRTHSVAYFIESILKHRQKEIEVIVYSDTRQQDRTTDRLKKYVTGWHDISMLDDDKVYHLVREHSIDVLVDLAGYSSRNRLAVFARRAAPVQASYLGYPDTTAVKQMDYRIVDAITDPATEPASNPEGSESHCTEKLLRLPDCFLCYTPYDKAPAVSPLPAETNDYLTFGCFNNLSKINEQVLVCWQQILEQLPQSRLLIKNPSFTDSGSRNRIHAWFSDRGIATDRILLQGRTKSVSEHLKQYNNIDIALDTFPYNGTTTTCEALWMGVPVISLYQDSHMSRVGKSLLQAAGMAELACASHEEYVKRACELASDMPALAGTRANMRKQLKQTALFDSKRFAANFYQTLCNLVAS